MQHVSDSRPAGTYIPDAISPDLLTKAMAMLSNDELDALDAELCEFDDTGVASPRVARIFDVVCMLETRRRERAA